MTDVENNMGFSGLSSLASGVDRIAPAGTRPKIGKGTPKSEGKRESTGITQAKSPPKTEAVSSQRSRPEVVAAGSSRRGGSRSSGVKWLLGLCVIGILIWLFSTIQEDSNKSVSGRADTQSGRVSNSTPPPQQQRVGLEYRKPNLGENNVLSLAQIRWCLREGIQIEALRPVLVSDLQVEQFNVIVSGYNRRCSSFRYHGSTLERARREVQAVRADIVSAATQSVDALLGRSDVTP